MNKLELINTMRNECQISKKEAATIVDLFFNKMANALAEGDRVEIRGLCSFYVKKYKAYAGRKNWGSSLRLTFIISSSKCRSCRVH